MKIGYKLQLLSAETMKLIGSTERAIDKDKNGEKIPKLKTSELLSVHFNLVNKNYQRASKVLFTLAPDKQFGQLITIAPHSLTMLKTINAEFQSTEVWFTDQTNRPLNVEDNVNMTLIIGIG